MESKEVQLLRERLQRITRFFIVSSEFTAVRIPNCDGDYIYWSEVEDVLQKLEEEVNVQTTE